MARTKTSTEERPFDPRAVRWDLLRRMYADDPLMAELLARMELYFSDDYSGSLGKYFKTSATPYWSLGTTTTATPMSGFTSYPSSGSTGTTFLTSPSVGTYSTGSSGSFISEPHTVVANPDGTFTVKYTYEEK